MEAFIFVSDAMVVDLNRQCLKLLPDICLFEGGIPLASVYK